MTYYPEVVQAIAAPNNHIIVYFSDGHIKMYDVTPLINKGGVFESLKDQRIFTDCLTVMNGTAAWDISGQHDESDCIDIDPFDLYEAKDIADPLAEESA